MAKTTEPVVTVTLTSPKGAVVTVAAGDQELYADAGYKPVTAPAKPAAKRAGRASK